MDLLDTFGNNFVRIQEKLDSVSYAPKDIVVSIIESHLTNGVTGMESKDH